MSEPAKKVSFEEEMQAWMKYAAPCEEHAFLARLEGKWAAHSKFWMSDAPAPEEADGTSENKMILGGRFLHSTYAGMTPYGPFEGVSIDGYDRLAEQHIGVWMDMMGTMMIHFKGQVDKSGNVREMIADHTDAVTGKPTQMKSRTTYINENEHVYEGFKRIGSGWKKNMEITYKRQSS